MAETISDEGKVTNPSFHIDNAVSACIVVVKLNLTCDLITEENTSYRILKGLNFIPYTNAGQAKLH